MYFIYIQEKNFNFLDFCLVSSAFNQLHECNKWHITCFNLQPVAVFVKKKKIEICIIYYYLSCIIYVTNYELLLKVITIN